MIQILDPETQKCLSHGFGSGLCTCKDQKDYKKNYETYNNERKEQVFSSNSQFHMETVG